MRFLIRVAANLAGLWVALQLVPSVQVPEGEETWQTWAYLALIAAILTVVNSLVRPVMRVVAFPIYLITFGLFSLVTNLLVFWLTSLISTKVGVPLEFLSWRGAWAAATITAIVSAIVMAILGPVRRGMKAAAF